MKTTNQLLLTCMISLLTACSPIKREMTGKFSGLYRWGFRPNQIMKLSLNKDSTFTVNFRDMAADYSKDTYSGYWLNREDKNIILDFTPPPLSRLLQSPLLDTKQRTIKVVNKNRLKYDDDTILKRIK